MKYIITLSLLVAFLQSCSDNHTVTRSIRLNSVDSEQIVLAQKNIEFERPGDHSNVEYYISSLIGFHHPLEVDKNKFIVPHSFSERAGIYDVIENRNSTITNVSKLVIQAGDSRGKITSFVGPKSILNDDREISELSFFTTDTFGNPTRMVNDIRVVVNTESVPANIHPNHHFGSYDFVSSDGHAKVIGVSSSNTFGQEHRIRTMPLCPVEIQLVSNHQNSIADGRTFFKVWTNVMVDSNDEIITDGTHTTFEIMEKSTNKVVGSYSSFTVNGMASSFIRKPSIPGDFKVTAKVCDKVKDLDIGELNSLVSDLNYTWTNDEIIIGPITNRYGQLVADGLPITVVMKAKKGNQSLEKSLVDGFVKFELEEFWFEQFPSSGLVDIQSKYFTIERAAL